VSSSSLTAGFVVPGYSRVASSYWTEAKDQSPLT
jgi:hypothetical protein